MHYGNIFDATSLMTIIQKVKPTEIYTLGTMMKDMNNSTPKSYTSSDCCSNTGIKASFCGAAGP